MMKVMNLRQLATFRAIVETGNFARAADRLDIGASTVTLHVQQLEAELGGPMFIRHGRRLALTELGASVHSHADAISAHVGAIAEEAAELAAAARGTVRIGGIEPLAHLDLVPLLARLGRERPHIRLRLDVGGTALLATSVADGRLAFAVCSAPPPELELVFEPLFREPIGLVLSDSHALAKHDGAIPASRLADQPIILSEPGCAYRTHVLDTFSRSGVDLTVHAEIGSTPAAMEAVRTGLGIALLPLAGLASPPRGTSTRAVDGLALGLDIGIVRPRAGEAYSALTSQVLAMVRTAAPQWADERRGR
jgi:LysR family transcriptional regulator, regulator of the ytmI operon